MNIIVHPLCRTFIFFFLFTGPLQASVLKPGFEKREYIDLLKISAQFMDSSFRYRPAAPEGYTHMLRGSKTGLDNRWDLWKRSDGVMVVSLRGTTRNAISWMENFYAAMVKADGSVQIDSGFVFNYKLAENPRAAIHIGWLIGMASLSREIIPVIDSACKAGTRDLIVTGHSQGGALSYLMTAYLLSLKKQGKLPADLQIKTYCSAAPKPGNLYFAYDFEKAMAGGWAFNVINSADWVPETPASVQTVNDYNTTNPFIVMDDALKRADFKTRVAVKYIYKRMARPTFKAQKKYEKYLGRLVSKFVKKELPGYIAPEYVKSSYYVRTGQQIVLLADDEYYNKFPDNRENVFIHHMFEPYLYLAEKLDP
ncbi:MAG: lipase family protein [Bacteroidia bacterium]